MEIVGQSGYRLGGVEVARSPLQRFRGLMIRPVVPLLLNTSRVHGFWLREPVNVVGITSERRVGEITRLDRRRLVRMRSATWVLEVPFGRPLPSPGDRLVFVPGPGEPDVHVRSTRHLRHPDRQPR